MDVSAQIFIAALREFLRTYVPMCPLPELRTAKFQKLSFLTISLVRPNCLLPVVRGSAMAPGSSLRVDRRAPVETPTWRP